MALNGAALGQAIKTAIDNVADKTDRDDIFEAIGTAIVNYLVTNTTVVVASVSGVTVGGGVSGPGAGTIS